MSRGRNYNRKKQGAEKKVHVNKFATLAGKQGWEKEAEVCGEPSNNLRTHDNMCPALMIVDSRNYQRGIALVIGCDLPEKVCGSSRFSLGDEGLYGVVLENVDRVKDGIEKLRLENIDAKYSVKVGDFQFRLDNMKKAYEVEGKNHPFKILENGEGVSYRAQLLRHVLEKIKNPVKRHLSRVD